MYYTLLALISNTCQFYDSIPWDYPLMLQGAKMPSYSGVHHCGMFAYGAGCDVTNRVARRQRASFHRPASGAFPRTTASALQPTSAMAGKTCIVATRISEPLESSASSHTIRLGPTTYRHREVAIEVTAGQTNLHACRIKLQPRQPQTNQAGFNMSVSVRQCVSYRPAVIFVA